MRRVFWERRVGLINHKTSSHHSRNNCPVFSFSRVHSPAEHIINIQTLSLQCAERDLLSAKAGTHNACAPQHTRFGILFKCLVCAVDQGSAFQKYKTDYYTDGNREWFMTEMSASIIKPTGCNVSQLTIDIYQFWLLTQENLIFKVTKILNFCHFLC